MNTAIWLLQGVLAAMFGMAGTMKATQTKEELVGKLPWVNDFSAEMVKSIGIAELLGAIGLIAPQLTGILPVLTPIAAVCLAIIMVLAAIYHFRKGEYQAIGFNTVLLVVALVVAYVRFKQ